MRRYKREASTNTRRMYEGVIETYFSQIPTVRLCDFSRLNAESLLDFADGKTKTQSNILLTVRQIIKAAVYEHLYPANEAADLLAALPRINYKAPERRVLYDYEREAMFAADLSPSDRAFVFLLYGTGIRREECAALTRFDFDLKKRTVNVNKALVMLDTGSEIKEPKSQNGFREIPIPEKVFPAIADYVRQCEGRLFSTNGGDLTKSAYTRMWRRIIKAMNEVSSHPVTGLTAHIFRHNFVTSLCYQIPTISIKHAAHLAGDTEAVILKTYNHIILEKEDSAGAVNRAMNF